MEKHQDLKAHLDYIVKTNDKLAGIDDRKKDLAIIRWHCLHRNKIFQSDCEKMRRLKKENPPDFRVKEKEFYKKWDIDQHGLSLTPEESVTVVYDGPIRMLGKPLDEAYINIRIDLLWPKRKIIDRIERIVEQYQSEYKELLNNPDYLLSDEYNSTKARSAEVSDKKQLRDFDLYKRYIQIWDLRNEGKSWSQIRALLDENKSPLATIEGIRHAFNKIDEFINEGFPGFAKFPVE